MTAKAAQKISLWEFFQQLGKTFMLPVALLSFCGIMLGIGSSLSSKDVITLIPFLGAPVLQAIFIWRLLSLLTKWLDVGLMCGNFSYVAAIRFVMCNELTSFRGNFMPHHAPSHHRTIIKLTRTRVVDDIRDHPKYRTRSVGYLILIWQPLPFTVLQVFQVWLRVCAIPLNPELTFVSANQK
jgi:hypothetical protein